jgi:light-regulated signal transduction histidine kinase (bacteriophytochrome)
MVGYSEQEMLSLEFLDITHPDDVKHRPAQTARLFADGRADFEKRYIHRDGHVVWVQLVLALAQSGEGPYLVAQAVDITARKEAEAASARHAAALERSNADLEQFAYVASHDMQQPLRTVSSYASLLADRYREQIEPRADIWIDHITNGVAQMQRLIDDLLILARVGTDSDGFAPTGADAIVRSVWGSLKIQNAKALATLDADVLPTLNADAAQIEVLFQNLLGNAFKYRRPSIPLEVSVAARRNGTGSASTWEFQVSDNGIGLDMAHAEHIFEIFRRLHRENEYEGTGIGLAICRKIVTRHGGQIWVNSVPGEGSTFSFTLREWPS